MVTPQDLLCRLSLFNMQLVKYQINHQVTDFSLKKIAKDELLCPFFLSTATVYYSSSTSPPCWVLVFRGTHTSGDRSFLLVSVFHNSPDCYSMSPLFFLSRGLLLILFHSPSTSDCASHLNLIWISNSIYLLCADSPWIGTSKLVLLSKQKYWPASLTYLCEFVTSRAS